ncbi:MAG: hypothetical protein ACP5N1_04780 [Candidatus Woesearchaeota archaeon]
MTNTYNNKFREIKMWLKLITIAAGISYFGLINPFLQADKRAEKQYKIEQTMRLMEPKVTEYNGEDSVQIERHIVRNRLNYKPSKKDKEIIYIKKADNINSETSNYKLTIIEAQKGEAKAVEIQKHIIQYESFRPQSGGYIDLSNIRRIYKENNNDYSEFRTEKYQEKYEYYKQKLDSIEQIVLQQNK